MPRGVGQVWGEVWGNTPPLGELVGVQDVIGQRCSRVGRGRAVGGDPVAEGRSAATAAHAVGMKNERVVSFTQSQPRASSASLPGEQAHRFGGLSHSPRQSAESSPHGGTMSRGALRARAA